MQAFQWHHHLLHIAATKIDERCPATLKRNLHNAVWMSQFSNLTAPCLSTNHMSEAILLTNTGGLGGMEIVKEMLEVAVDSLPPMRGDSLAFRGGHCHSAVDIDAACRSVLARNNGAPQHIFSDMLDLVRPDMRVQLLRLMEAHQELVNPMIHELKSKSTPAPAGAPDATAHRKLMKENIKDKGEKLLHDLMCTMDDCKADDLFVTHARCSKHNATCQILPDRDGPMYRDASLLHSPGVSQLQAPIDIMVSGTSCVDWSSMGNSLNLAGRSVLPFSVQLQLVKRAKPVVWFHECTRTFDPKIFGTYLPDYKVYSSIQRPTLHPVSISCCLT